MTNAVKLFRYLINRKRSPSSGSVKLPTNNSCRWLPRTTYEFRNFKEGISFTAVSNVREIDPLHANGSTVQTHTKFCDEIMMPTFC